MKKVWKTPKKFLVGIDEVGRGSLAGPVAVAAVVLPPGRRFKNLKDSKKMSARQRRGWFNRIQADSRIAYAWARVYAPKIDRINITEAANLAATRAFKRLTAGHLGLATRVKIYLDGGLYLNGDYPAKTVIKGDEKYSAIKLASIVAKVTRDRYMEKLHKEYPVYGFDKHKGYGTKEHLAAIRKHGHSKVHRLTFIRKYLTI